MSLLREARKILSTYRIRPKKRLGQNFLVDDKILDRIIQYASVNKSDRVLEIGAGLGFLTERLAKKADQVIAVEIDSRLTKILTKRLRRYGNVIILEGDILKIKPPEFDKVVSVPPYSISSPLLFWLLRKDFEIAVLTFQEEFSRRLVAPAGTKDYGRLTISVYYHAEAKLLETIPKEAFWPMPKVNSAIVRLKPRGMPFYVEDKEEFSNFVRDIFTQRNKKLRNAVYTYLNRLGVSKKEAVEIANSIPFFQRRTRELMPEELGLAFNELFRKLQNFKTT